MEISNQNTDHEAAPKLPTYHTLGKTTLLQNILKNRSDMRCAVIVNDMASMNIDV